MLEVRASKLRLGWEFWIVVGAASQNRIDRAKFSKSSDAMSLVEYFVSEASLVIYGKEPIRYICDTW
jgi:hypothetical protein